MKLLLSSLVVLLCLSAYAQQTTIGLVKWSTLDSVTYSEMFVKEWGDYMAVPVFPEHVKQLNGSQIEVEGYVIPLDRSGRMMMLSARPNAECFFCGKGSPTSVMKLAFKHPSVRYEMDAYKRFRGKLIVDKESVFGPFYFLEQAEEVEVGLEAMVNR